MKRDQSTSVSCRKGKTSSQEVFLQLKVSLEEAKFWNIFNQNKRGHPSTIMTLQRSCMTLKMESPSPMKILASSMQRQKCLLKEMFLPSFPLQLKSRERNLTQVGKMKSARSMKRTSTSAVK